MWKFTIACTALILTLRGTTQEAAKEQDDCECIPYYLCNDPDVNDKPRGKKECESYLDVCCKKSVPVLNGPPRNPHECGIRNPEGIGFRITSSSNDEAQYGEFPWMVGVLTVEMVSQQGVTNTVNVYKCGGSLIHPSVVLTGAHCVSGKEASQLRIRAGEWDTKTKNELYPHQDRDVKKVVIHENFNSSNLFNDVALLFLSEPVDPQENIGFVCLPPKDYLPLPATRCTASGWGKDKFEKEGAYQAILKKVELPVVDNPACQELLRKTRLGNQFKLDSSFMCAGGEEGNDSCRGDGGSPLVCPLKDKKHKYVQSGMVAWGIGCGTETPGVYVNVALFRDWIDSTMALENLDNFYYVY